MIANDLVLLDAVAATLEEYLDAHGAFRQGPDMPERSPVADLLEHVHKSQEHARWLASAAPTNGEAR